MKLVIASIAIFVSTALTGCATPPLESAEAKLPESFVGIESTEIKTEDEFLSEVGGRELNLIANGINANLIFRNDNSATGQLVRGNGEIQDMNLAWEWEGNVYCRTGTIGANKTERKCERVILYPGVGVQLSYTDSDDPDEFWTFD